MMSNVTFSVGRTMSVAKMVAAAMVAELTCKIVAAKVGGRSQDSDCRSFESLRKKGG
jgi:hypothetical protein